MRRSATRLLLLLFVLLGLGAPWLANDVPLLARVDGALRVPSWSSLDAQPPTGYADWHTWLADLPREATDWAVLPPWPYGPDQVHPEAVLTPPSTDHPLGTDDTGRDLLSRLVHGLRTALWVGAGATLLAALLGIPAGLAAGLRRGATESLVRFLIQVCTAVPLLIALIAVSAFVGGGLVLVVAVLAFAQWPTFARVTRGELLSLRERGWVETARALGVRGPRLWFGHLAPNLRGPLRVTAALLAIEAILSESALTFLGLGAGLGRVSLGAMLDQGRDHAHLAGAWHLWVVPATALALLALTIHAAASPANRRAGLRLAARGA